MSATSKQLAWNHDGIEFSGTVHRADTATPHATILVVHGLGEYSGRYHPFAEFWTSHGWDLVTFDARGHGRSGGARGDAPAVDTLVFDAAAAITTAVRELRTDRLVVYGHSLGGLVTLRLALLYPHLAERVHAYVAASPALTPGQPQPRWKVGLGRLLRPLVPRFGMSNGIVPDDLSSDERIVPRFGEDPLLHRRISVRLGLSILDDGPALLEAAAAGKISAARPVLLMHGDQDRVTSHPASEALASHVEGLELRSWPGFRHELHNEPRRLEVLDCAEQWFLATLRAED